MSDSKDVAADATAALPTKLPAMTIPTGPAALSRFGPAKIDYAINQHLEDLVPDEVDSLVFDVKLKSAGEEKLVQGVLAVRGEGGWGGALGFAIDPGDLRNYEVEVLVEKSFGKK